MQPRVGSQTIPGYTTQSSLKRGSEKCCKEQIVVLDVSTCSTNQDPSLKSTLLHCTIVKFPQICANPKSFDSIHLDEKKTGNRPSSSHFKFVQSSSNCTIVIGCMSGSTKQFRRWKLVWNGSHRALWYRKLLSHQNSPQVTLGLSSTVATNLLQLAEDPHTIDWLIHNCWTTCLWKRSIFNTVIDLSKVLLICCVRTLGQMKIYSCDHWAFEVNGQYSCMGGMY